MKKSTSPDFKSAVIGFLGAAFIFIIFAFNKPTEGPIGRYQGHSSEEGFMIVDTQTGNYIIDDRSSFSGKTIWTKGSFQDTFEKGVNRAASKKQRGN